MTNFGPPGPRVLIAVDDPGRRRMYAAALAGAGCDVVETEAADEGAVRASAARQPAALVVEAARPAVEGAKVVGRLREVAPRACVLAVASPADRPRTRIARRLTADRYVDPDEALAAIVGVLRDALREHDRNSLAS